MTSKFRHLAVTPAYNRKVAGQIWFLHGAFDTGLGTQNWLRQILNRSFNFYDYEVLYPTAAQDNSKDYRMWYHQPRITPDLPEDEVSIMKSAETLSKSISERASAAGLPLSKVIVGGFSQGGTIALHLAYRQLAQQLAGCFALSTFLPPDSRIFKTLHDLKQSTTEDLKPSPNLKQEGLPGSKLISTPLTIPVFATTFFPQTSAPTNFDRIKATSNENNVLKNTLPKLFMGHGIKDPVVRYDWARNTFVQLKDHGVDGTIYAVSNGEHNIAEQTLRMLHLWIQETLSSSDQGSSGDDELWKRIYSNSNSANSMPSNPSDSRS